MGPHGPVTACAFGQVVPLQPVGSWGPCRIYTSIEAKSVGVVRVVLPRLDKLALVVSFGCVIVEELLVARRTSSSTTQPAHRLQHLLFIAREGIAIVAKAHVRPKGFGVSHYLVTTDETAA